MRIIPLTLSLIFLLMGCQQGEDPEQLYIESMIEWFSAEGTAWGPDDRESQLSNLGDLRPTTGWETRHSILLGAYRSMVIMKANEDGLQQEEQIRFASRGDDHIPACDILQYLGDVSNGYRAACHASSLEFSNWANLEAIWKLEYMDYYGR
jgi:hypothetical protein